ncbi:MAG: SUMF1/EgtB/PvdO family nonheme iron enzyme [Prevotellaceae bacterium]|jgi:formylglycine-generating enzyme required for sulfatase activity|nr:SUMF1/EgtB/PvdO family nonheme iron enzyme [Prevotellaceae bacterium]
MKQKLFIVLIVFVTIGYYCKGQDLKRERCASGKYGFIDRTGREVVPCKYDYVWHFNERLAPVKLNGKWGYIDMTGNEVIPLKYDYAKYFNRGLAAVQLNGKEMHIDKQGNEYATEEEALKAVFVEPEMVFVEGGTFLMGCTGEQQDSSHDCDEDEKPVREVTLGSFYIGKYEVTQMQWKTLMGSNPSYSKGDSLPVENMYWRDVQKFIERLNAVTGRNYRLPTEAEWEYAARGGNQSKGYKYSGSNLAKDVAWFSEGKTRPAGTKQPNELGIYDMSGNVYEWCDDWFDTCHDSAQNNLSGASSELDTGDTVSLSDTLFMFVFCDRSFNYRHVIRGGSFSHGAYYCRVADRGNSPSHSCFINVGFRIARSLE